MATESIGTLIPTAIPGFEDAADIQTALRAYHYGSYSYDPGNTSPASLVANSMAKYIYDIEQNIILLENRPYLGDVSDEPPQPGDFISGGILGIPNGYIWLDEDGSIGSGPSSATAVFTASAPSLSLTTGLIWIDKDPDTPAPGTPISSEVKPAYVYDQDTSTWYPFSEAGTLSSLTDVTITSPTTNQVLTYNGTRWVNTNEAGDITAVTSGTGISVTNSTGPIPSVAVDTSVVATTSNTLTFSNKTISGTSNTITNVSITSGVSGLGTGVATFLATPSSANLLAAVTDETGTGSLVFGTSPTVVTPTLTLSTTSSTTDGRVSWDATNDQLRIGDGTTTRTISPDDKAATLTNKTISGSTNTLSNIANASLTNSSITVNGTSVSLGSSGSITVPVTSGITGLGAGVATFLATPSSANLLSAVTDETGTGSLVFNSSPSLVGAVSITGGYVTRSYTSITTVNYTVTATDTYIVNERTAGTTVTLPTATAGRELYFKTHTAGAIASASSNVVPRIGGTPTSAIVPASDGSWAYLVGNGTNWEIMASS
jgi:hypothetical protein